jgi:hypothetical protein
MRKLLMSQSRSAMSSGVPDIASLSKIASLAEGVSSGASSKAGDPRRKRGFTSSTRVSLCQAIAVRSCDTPDSSFGSDMCRV